MFKRDDMLRAAAGVSAFDRPALFVWAAEGRLMSQEPGPRLAATLSRGRLVTVPDGRTRRRLDQPVAFAAAIREFVREGACGFR